MKKFIIAIAALLLSLQMTGQTTVELVYGETPRLFIERTGLGENFTSFAYIEADYKGGAMVKLFHEQKFWETPIFAHVEYQTQFTGNHTIILWPSYTFGLNNGFVSLSAFYRLDTRETVSSPQLSNAYLLAYKWLEFNGFNHLWYSNGFCFFGEERIHFNITQKFKVGFICDITHFGEWRIIPQAGIRFDI